MEEWRCLAKRTREVNEAAPVDVRKKRRFRVDRKKNPRLPGNLGTLACMDGSRGSHYSLMPLRWIPENGDLDQSAERKGVYWSQRLASTSSIFFWTTVKNIPWNTLQLIEFKFQRDILGAVRAVIIRKTAASDLHILAHVDAPCVVRVAAE